MSQLQIAIPIFPAFTALDAIGPYEVLQRVPGAEVVFCAAEAGPVRTEQAMAAIVADRSLAEVERPDVIVVPGGVGKRQLLDPDGPYASWIAGVHPHTQWTTSVCTGSLLLAAAGLLDGVEATTHWAVHDLLGELGAVPADERVVERGKVMTAAGVSSGIDMALRLAERLAGSEVAQAIQLGIEYDPDPPYDTGSVGKAPEPRRAGREGARDRGPAGGRAARIDSPPVGASRIFSGIQPTGRKHLGNYIGAIRQYVEGQDGAEGELPIYCIVDLHAITVDYDPAELRERVHDTAAILLAAGLDPDRCILFRQGDVREHTELCWLLGGGHRLGRPQPDAPVEGEAGAGRGADRRLRLRRPLQLPGPAGGRRARLSGRSVPVGDDQRQHIELMREVARRFNERFGPTLVEPEHRIPEIGARIMDLQDPTAKMSTTGGSEAGTVYVLDEPDAVAKKFRSAVTDSGRESAAARARRGSRT